MLITSLANNKIKSYLKLKTKKYRDTFKLFMVEGEHLVLEALKTNLVVDVLVLDGVEASYDFKYTYVTKEIMKKLSSLENIPKAIAILKMPEERKIIGDKVLLLDDIQDPGNLGTIIRSSLAFNVQTIILSSNTVDLYNEKVLRSTQGMLFKINILRADLFEQVNLLKQQGFLILGTNVTKGVDVRDIKTQKFALIMGNEGVGVKQELQALCDQNLYIKMNKDCESLNVGVATSILLYELNR